MWALAQAPPLPEERPILGEVEAYDQQIAALDAQIATLDQEATAREGTLREATLAADQARQALDRDRGGMRTLVRAYYRLSRRGIARLLFDAEDPAELRRRVRYLGALLLEHRARTEAYSAAAKTRTDAEGAAKSAAEAAAKARAELDTRRAQLAVERQRRIDLLNAVRGSRGLSAKVAVEQSTAREDFSRSVAVREATVPAATAAGPAAAFRAARGRLPRPVDGPVLSPFGTRTDAVTGEVRSNLGIDLAAPAGTPFRAVFAGTVTRSGYVRGYGQVVMVQHGSYTTLYAHANGLRVAEGQEVAQGDILGLVGTTGVIDDDRARLHFEVRYNGTPQDPAEWLSR